MIRIEEVMMQYSNNLKRLQGLMILMLLLITFSVSARGVYQTKEAFLQEVFTVSVPQSQVIWLKGEVREQVSQIMGHPYHGLRIRYWQQASRSAWILEEIGKEEPISFGIVVDNQQIEQVKVLEYRESRGWEVKHPAFTQQFVDASLVENKLDKHIDGITGATLSVRAMTKVVTLALYLDRVSRQ
jgi:hypothetical protein